MRRGSEKKTHTGFYYESKLVLGWTHRKLKPLLNAWKQNPPCSVDKCLDYTLLSRIA